MYCARIGVAILRQFNDTGKLRIVVDRLVYRILDDYEYYQAINTSVITLHLHHIPGSTGVADLRISK
jgi:hypothetical protein